MPTDTLARTETAPEPEVVALTLQPSGSDDRALLEGLLDLIAGATGHPREPGQNVVTLDAEEAARVTATLESAVAQLTHQRKAAGLLQRANRILAGDVRDSDLLQLPPEEAAKVEAEIQLAESLYPDRVMSEAERTRVRQDRALEHFYAGHPVACIQTPKGVIVLASGLAEIGKLVRTVPGEKWKDVVVRFPQLL